MNIVLPILLFAGLGLLAGILLTVASKVFYVKVDEKLENVQNSLPQINCGACGFTGCNDYADAIVNRNEKTNMCKPGGQEAAQKISAIMGVEAGEVERMTAFVRCNGTCEAAPTKFKFDGIKSCAAANRFYQGEKFCTNGCLGYGDCIDVCTNDAITIINGIAHIDDEKCMGCGMCEKVCPNSLITVRRKIQKVEVICSSTSSGRITRKLCSNGCIGCKMCEKACHFDAIKIENNYAKIDYSKCINCGACVSACKMGVIKKI